MSCEWTYIIAEPLGLATQENLGFGLFATCSAGQNMIWIRKFRIVFIFISYSPLTVRIISVAYHIHIIFIFVIVNMNMIWIYSNIFWSNFARKQRVGNGGSLLAKRSSMDYSTKRTLRDPIMSWNVELRCLVSLNFNVPTFLIASSCSWLGVSAPERGWTWFLTMPLTVDHRTCADWGPEAAETVVERIQIYLNMLTTILYRIHIVFIFILNCIHIQ